MATKQILKPRFYADFGQYLKAMGYYDGSELTSIASQDYQEHGISNAEDIYKAYTMNPYQINSYNIINGSDRFDIEFWMDQPPASAGNMLPINNYEFSRLLTKTNYAGVLGHNMTNVVDSTGYNNPIMKFEYYGKDSEPNNLSYVSQNESTQIANYSSGYYNHNGLSLWKIVNLTGNTDNGNSFSAARFTFNASDGETFESNQVAKIGALTWGRYFEPEYSDGVSASIDLNSSHSISYDGIKRQNTIMGNTYTNINHLGVPMWGDIPAWATNRNEENDTYDYKAVARNGRRQWKIGLSFLSDGTLFNASTDYKDSSGVSHNFANQFFEWKDNADGYVFNDTMASFFKLTFNGKIPFIFAPDSSQSTWYKREFALCIISNKPTFKQVANNLFSTNLTITEVF